MAERRQRSFSNRCLSFLFSCGLSALFIWLALRVTRPTCSIEQFDAFALDKTANSSHANHTIYYDLKLKNRNFNKGIYYDALNLTFYYQSNMNSLIRNTRFDPFYQGHGKSTHRVGSINPRGVNWEKSTSLNRNGSTGFKVVLATAIRYKMVFWTTKRHRLVVGADLQVNDNGSLIKAKKNKGIKLISSIAPKIKRWCLGFLPLLIAIAWI